MSSEPNRSRVSFSRDPDNVQFAGYRSRQSCNGSGGSSQSPNWYLARFRLMEPPCFVGRASLSFSSASYFRHLYIIRFSTPSIKLVVRMLYSTCRDSRCTLARYTSTFDRVAYPIPKDAFPPGWSTSSTTRSQRLEVNRYDGPVM